MNLTNAEMLIMNLLWNNGQLRANQISEYMIDEKGWKKNTTYTLINRLVKKGAIEKVNPGFLCRPLIQVEEARIKETRQLLDKIYNGSFKLLVQNFIQNEDLSKDDIEEILKMIDEVKKNE
ncbi:BlaI/MecI/CopY family transcriptional regulator [Clostridium sp. 'deep sea']|uniref:BlaI/MecI/CopY family transcriptional regulator n=1 Tax=Clostridium sp. 'deep sea' TaxID=2779445 RepID=UPI001896A0E3|nr:BlaI/MecI/CopY family transcriptional regulator [Clostridium sp. 'deep sea']QOR34843.1 BlaI/MecI/CopY family transcriptional regulator [Clostridium sp. 'deep sea']